mgnify:CR=1 FL=1
MTIIEKIKQSVEGATSMPFLYHAAGELNELIARCGELPVAYSFLIDSGTIDDVNGRYHERVTIAVMFCDKTEFDFNALENEQIIDRMKVKAYKWMQSLRMSNALRVISVNNTQRLYDNTTDILTGFAVNITLEDIAGVGECELPDVVFEIKENGEYPVVGIDKVLVNVLPKSTDIVITENGEYYPNDYEVDAFSKVDVDVKPKLEDLTATDNGTYTPSEGFDGFGKVNVDLRGIVKPSNLISFYQSKIVDSENKDVIYLHDELSLDLIDLTNVKSANNLYSGVNFTDNVKNKKVFYTLKQEFSPTNIIGFFELANTNIGELYVDLKKLNTTKITSFNRSLGTALSSHCWYDIRFDTLNSVSDINVMPNSHGCYTLVGDSTLDEVIQNNICCFSNVSQNLLLSTLNLNGGKNNTPLINRATLRSIVQGLLNVDSPKNLRINATLDSVMTDEERAIATNKGWTIII